MSVLAVLRISTGCLLFLTLLMLAGTLHGQGSARIAGVVQDPAGAVIAGAEVTLTHVATSVSRRMTASSEGYYAFLDLTPGTYNLTATARGFKTFSQSGITVQVGRAVTVNISLELGSVSESVTVTGEAALVNTQTSTIQQTVDTKRITELPLNGRNIVQLVSLLPGVVSWGSSGQFGFSNLVFVINGARSLQNNYEMDGGTNVNFFWNVPNDYPNPDAVQEFTAKTHSFSAVHGRNAGAVIQAATKSGTNEFHGSAFEFLRNTVFDARSFFSAKRPAFHRNQYGGTIGGPITKNRSFFFFSFQGTNQRGSPGTIDIFPLTPAEQSGDFSGQKPVIDPLNNQPFPGNRIPANRQSPVIRKFLQRFPMPAPNGPAGRYSYAGATKYDQKQFLVRVDSELTAKDRLMGRFYWNDIPSVSPWSSPPGSNWFPSQPTREFNYSASWTRTFAPALLNQAQLTYEGGYIDYKVAFPWDWGQAGANVIPSSGSGTADFGAVVSGKINWQTGPPTRDRMPTTEFKDVLSIIRGRHSVQTGIQIYRNRQNQIQDHQTGGVASWNGYLTGIPAADFILGEMNSYVQYSGFSSRLRQTLFSAFVQDDIKMSPRFTLNLGLRWDPYLPFKSQNGQLAAFIPGRQSERFPNSLPGLLYPGDPGIRPTVISPDLNNFAPRVGFAWDPFGQTRTSIRASYGIFYDPLTRGISLNRFMLMPPFQLQVTTFAVNIANPWSTAPFNGRNPFPFPTAGDDASLRKAPVFASQGATAFQLDMRTPYNQHWDLSIQHELFKDYLLTVAYVGMKGTHLYQSINMNPSVYIPGQSTLANTQQRRLYPWVGRIEQERADAYSNYNALQLSFEKRYSRGFTLLANYTYGKTLGLNVGSENEGGNGERNPWNWALDYGRLSYDIRHNFVASFVWELPSGTFTNRLAKYSLGGWNLNGILSARTGAPFTVSAGQDRSLTSIGRDTADLVGNASISGGRSRDALMARYFNTAAFAMPALGTFGTSGINVLEAPGSYNIDMGIFKNFPAGEGQRIQFRLETFNSLNHANLGGPDANLSSGTFGRILSTSGPRVVELGLKFQF
jgi:hypothetical protein